MQQALRGHRRCEFGKVTILLISYKSKWKSRNVIGAIATFALVASSCANAEDLAGRKAGRFDNGWHPSWTTVWPKSPFVAKAERDQLRIVRATFESMWLAVYYGKSKVFPGYLRALEGASSIEMNVFEGGDPEREDLAWRATNYVTVTSLKRSNDRVSADVCMVRRWSSEDPDRARRMDRARVAQRMRIEVVETSSEPPHDREERGQEDSYNASGVHAGQIPNYDVFQGWRIDVLETRSTTDDWNCVDWSSSILPGSAAVVTRPGVFELRGPDLAMPIQAQSPRWDAE